MAKDSGGITFARTENFSRCTGPGHNIVLSGITSNLARSQFDLINTAFGSLRRMGSVRFRHVLVATFPFLEATGVQVNQPPHLINDP